MTWLTDKSLNTKKGGTVYPITIRSLVLDSFNNHGDPDFTMLRMLQLALDAAIINITAGGGNTFGQSSSFFSLFADRLFLSKYSKTGNFFEGTFSASSPLPHEYRAWYRFGTPVVANRIIMNNGHNSGNQTSRGAKDIVIQYSEDLATPSNTFNAPVVGGVPIFIGSLREHVPFDQADDEGLSLF